MGLEYLCCSHQTEFNETYSICSRQLEESKPLVYIYASPWVTAPAIGPCVGYRAQNEAGAGLRTEAGHGAGIRNGAKTGHFIKFPTLRFCPMPSRMSSPMIIPIPSSTSCLKICTRDKHSLRYTSCVLFLSFM